MGSEEIPMEAKIMVRFLYGNKNYKWNWKTVEHSAGTDC